MTPIHAAILIFGIALGVFMCITVAPGLIAQRLKDAASLGEGLGYAKGHKAGFAAGYTHGHRAGIGEGSQARPRQTEGPDSHPSLRSHMGTQQGEVKTIADIVEEIAAKEAVGVPARHGWQFTPEMVPSYRPAPALAEQCIAGDRVAEIAAPARESSTTRACESTQA